MATTKLKIKKGATVENCKPMTLFANPVIREILDEHKPISTFKQSFSLMEWDLEVNMP